MFSIYKEVWKIVKGSMSYLQIVAFSISSLIGLFVIFFAVHCYLDFTHFIQNDSSIFKKEFIIVSKKVSVLQTLTNKPIQFNKREILRLKKQPFFKQVDEFESSLFPVTLFTQSTSLPPIKTDFFFESVPNQYIQVDMLDWQWNEGQTYIPLVLPQNFLSLYNYGFAPSQGLPQLSESLFYKIPLKIRVSGNGKFHIYDARVVGFSQRINTILVPEKFLHWANKAYGEEKDVRPSRLILECENLADSRIFEYITNENYQINDESLLNSKLSFYLKLTLTIVGLIGITITALALWLLVFSFQLIIEKNKLRMQNLYYLGYSFSNIMLPYVLISFVLNILLVIISLLFSFYAHSFVIEKLQVLVEIESSGIVVPIIVSVLLVGSIIALHYITIKRAVRNAVLSNS